MCVVLFFVVLLHVSVCKSTVATSQLLFSWSSVLFEQDDSVHGDSTRTIETFVHANGEPLVFTANGPNSFIVLAIPPSNSSLKSAAKLHRYEVDLGSERDVVLHAPRRDVVTGGNTPKPTASNEFKRGQLAVPSPVQSPPSPLQKRDSYDTLDRRVVSVKCVTDEVLGIQIDNAVFTNIASADLDGNGDRDVVVSTTKTNTAGSDKLFVAMDALTDDQRVMSNQLFTSSSKVGDGMVVVDVDGNGFDDVVVTAPWRAGENLDDGGATLILGDAGPYTVKNLTSDVQTSVLDGHFGESVASCWLNQSAANPTLVLGVPGKVLRTEGPFGSLVSVSWQSFSALSVLFRPWNDEIVGFGRHLACGNDASNDVVLVTTAVAASDASAGEFYKSRLLVYLTASQLSRDASSQPSFTISQSELLHPDGAHLGKSTVVVDMNGDGQPDIFSTYVSGEQVYGVVVLGPLSAQVLVPMVVALSRADNALVRSVYGSPLVLYDGATRPSMLLLHCELSNTGDSSRANEVLGFSLPLQVNGSNFVSVGRSPPNGETTFEGVTETSTTPSQSNGTASTTVEAPGTAATTPGTESLGAPALSLGGPGESSSTVTVVLAIVAGIVVCALVVVAVVLAARRRTRRQSLTPSSGVAMEPLARGSERGRGYSASRVSSRSVLRQRSEKHVSTYEHAPRRPAAADMEVGKVHSPGYITGNLGGYAAGGNDSSPPHGYTSGALGGTLAQPVRPSTSEPYALAPAYTTDSRGSPVMHPVRPAVSFAYAPTPGYTTGTLGGPANQPVRPPTNNSYGTLESRQQAPTSHATYAVGNLG